MLKISRKEISQSNTVELNTVENYITTIVKKDEEKIRQ